MKIRDFFAQRVLPAINLIQAIEAAQFIAVFFPRDKPAEFANNFLTKNKLPDFIVQIRQKKFQTTFQSQADCFKKPAVFCR